MAFRSHRIHGQMSEAYITAVFLTLSGGFQDAYTYFFRGGVFANAQTGNIVLMSSHLFRGEWLSAVRYMIPLLSFGAGTYAAELVHRRFKPMEKVHWRQLILLDEIIILFIVGFFPQSWSIPANAMVSFVCAMQVQSFRKVSGNAYASTMCIGNIRSGTEALCVYFHTKDRMVLQKALQYFGVIFLFAVGAGSGCVLTACSGQYAIWYSCILLTVSFCMMFIKEEISDNPQLHAIEQQIHTEIAGLGQSLNEAESVLKKDIQQETHFIQKGEHHEKQH